MRVLEELMISCMWWLLLPKGELQKDTTAEPELHCRLESVSLVGTKRLFEKMVSGHDGVRRGTWMSPTWLCTP
jgi:hypothetical protein